MPDLLVVVDDVAQVVASAVVCFPHAHTIVREVDVAVVAEELGHVGGVVREGRRGGGDRWVFGDGVLEMEIQGHVIFAC